MDVFPFADMSMGGLYTSQIQSRKSSTIRIKVKGIRVLDLMREGNQFRSVAVLSEIEGLSVIG